MSTFLLIAIPAGCFVVMVGLLAFGLCRAAAAGDRQQAGPPSVDPGARPLCAPGSADLSKPAEGVRHGGNQKAGPGRTRTASRPVLDDRPLLTLVDERRTASRLYPSSGRDVRAVPRHQPSRHPDGSTSDWTRSFDVIADTLAAPPLPGDDAA